MHLLQKVDKVAVKKTGCAHCLQKCRVIIVNWINKPSENKPLTDAENVPWPQPLDSLLQRSDLFFIASSAILV